MARMKSTNEDGAEQGTFKSGRGVPQESGDQGESSIPQERGNQQRLDDAQDNGAEQDRDEDGAGRQPAINLTVSTLRTLGQLFDMQAATARIMWRAQARAASAFGAPDFSRMFQVSDDRGHRLFSAVTDNVSQMLQQVGPLTEVHSQMGRMFEQGAIDLNERWKIGVEEMQQQAKESILELKELSDQQVEEMARATESLTDATRASLREGGEKFRATVRQGREVAARQAEMMRGEAEQAAGEAEDEGRDGVEEGGDREGGQRGQKRSGGGRSRHAA